ncbi:MAG: hypothetical protein GC168_04810 [Candidatus Hydrogenedens sp.]|nr:hypothetical protein [Candidatus Hydrogenedens sp.]
MPIFRKYPLALSAALGIALAGCGGPSASKDATPVGVKSESKPVEIAEAWKDAPGDKPAPKKQEAAKKPAKPAEPTSFLSDLVLNSSFEFMTKDGDVQVWTFTKGAKQDWKPFKPELMEVGKAKVLKLALPEGENMAQARQFLSVKPELLGRKWRLMADVQCEDPKAVQVIVEIETPKGPKTVRLMGEGKGKMNRVSRLFTMDKDAEPGRIAVVVRRYPGYKGDVLVDNIRVQPAAE